MPNYDLEKFTITNNFHLCKLKMQAILSKQGLDEDLDHASKLAKGKVTSRKCKN